MNSLIKKITKRDQRKLLIKESVCVQGEVNGITTEHYTVFGESSPVRCERVCNHGFVAAKTIDVGFSVCNRC